MNCHAPKTLIEHFSALEDPRDPSKCRHQLLDIAIAAVRCGADDLTGVEQSSRVSNISAS